MKELKLYIDDPWLEPWKDIIKRRRLKYLLRSQEISGYGKPLKQAINSHLYYGVTRGDNGEWIFREWAPGADAIHLIGEMNGWRKSDEFSFKNIGSGNWELVLPKERVKDKMLFKWLMSRRGEEFERIPAYALRVVQDEATKLFSAQIPDQKLYEWRYSPLDRISNPLIYEAHIGMSSEEPAIATFNYFRENVLPYIAQLGYNTIQLMAIQEHPYYGSFGYQVSNFFAVSSRFGTPGELKQLIDEAHGLGIAVILDIIHSHSVSNTLEGLSLFDGTEDLYFHSGERGRHPAWDSRCFDYGKSEVIHFLLSNCKYWLEEFRFDGFRFDGVTSMLYFDHGLERDFTDYSCYFNGNQDEDAIVYLTMANQLVKEINPNAITIAEDMSGLPGLATPIENGGVGFDFRMSMGVPDHWIKWIKELRDEDWHVGTMFHELTNKRADERSISYAECHDQAMVGDKTIIFRLLDSEMYTSMDKEIESLTIDRGLALHKMIRLATIATAGDGYLNFMGNEFGHPEWIDFPREGNGWSYHYARRQWSLIKNERLRYDYLLQFDKAMINLVKNSSFFDSRPQELYSHYERQILIFKRANYIFVFNFSPTNSYTDLTFTTAAGAYKIVLDTDSPEFGGYNRNDHSQRFITQSSGRLSIYLPSRTAICFGAV